MAVRGVFQLGGEVIDVIIQGNNLMFHDSSGMITTLEGLKLDKSGVVKEFPDLKEDEDWRKKAIERFKEHYKTMKQENDKLDYVKNELTKFGWTPLFFQPAGFRPKKFKEKT